VETISPQRARYILENKLIGGDLRFSFARQPSGPIHADGITRAEDAAVRRVWQTMPGSACYYSAVCEIANGRATQGDE
jgi:hypothetical protein